MDVLKVRDRLTAFVEMTTLERVNRVNGGVPYVATMTRAPDASVRAEAQVVEQLLDAVLPQWRTVEHPDKSRLWRQHHRACVRAISELDHREQVTAMLGDDAPSLSARAFHPWAWQGARSMWSVGSYDRAVEDALARVNAETRNKVDRRDLGETKLFQLVFSTEAPKPGVPRLRLMADDGSDTYKSVHRGAATLAEGLFALLRNPAAHEVRTHEGQEQVALERLAAVSTLARTVDQAQVVWG